MLIAGSGHGRWILASAFGSMALMTALDGLVLPPGAHGWLRAAGLAPAGLFWLALGLQARRRPARTVVELQTGRDRLVRPSHTLFWIPAEYWGAVFLGGAALATLVRARGW